MRREQRVVLGTARRAERIAAYLYDDTTGTSSLIREYIWANGALAGVYENGALYLVRTDHIGRPVFATDDTGLKVWEASYLPFGGVVASSGPNSDLRFPGQWFQSESGLHQNWMRDYDPTLGRYIQADPLGIQPGPGLYDYAYQSPMKYVDPDGEHPLLAAALLAGLGSLAFDFLFDKLSGDNCYTLREGLTAFGLGALTGGGGFAATGLKRAGKEFSHSIPSRMLKNTRLGRWMDRRSNQYRSLNGNYVSPRTHAKTDYYRMLSGMKARDMYNPMFRYPMRAPAWLYGSQAWLISGDQCECSI